MSLVAASYSSVSSADPLALGVVERVDLEHSAITVLGQQYYVSPGTLVTSEGSTHARTDIKAKQNAPTQW